MKTEQHIRGFCIYCEDIISKDGPEPLQVYYPIDRIRQKLKLGLVHDICFMRAFFKFNDQLDEKGQLKNHHLLLVHLFENKLKGNTKYRDCLSLTIQDLRNRFKEEQ